MSSVFKSDSFINNKSVICFFPLSFLKYQVGILIVWREQFFVFCSRQTQLAPNKALERLVTHLPVLMGGNLIPADQRRCAAATLCAAAKLPFLNSLLDCQFGEIQL
jgi:hypothetical protein